MREEAMIAFLCRAKCLRPKLSYRAARDILWTLTGSDVYGTLVHERGWRSQKYHDWLLTPSFARTSDRVGSVRVSPR